ncbi:MAG: 30S ribosomal protein S5 [Aminobacterium sp.]|jgi:small subunit ribosomal protein S5|uniref:30S ribosomal protein S5 n=1 Tax=unclassified Aminobacterium TaxID=2685012 RepID=UPI001BCAC1E6|nr:MULTISPECIES: 30S ribosomal protein S5 [unclassified Aminobacterium]MDD2207398.1 30S ribosomal protein S5 [Aminobacterium sp.]MDD3426976.1 30S ribosomal protein S5 [Aminobacterium sp.]MDD3707861.1 30S ribosomal protein S5 [Aminobacterium sp.]MDD4229423.1 30S ribosomal protein S5 [Aminobacterium sp.]MDD4552123.1 30S ribosomal protein S5 [Aminobacterium sp.]
MTIKRVDAKGLELSERVVAINRVSKVVKGGKRFKFSVLVVVGDGEHYVGVGMGKAKEISEAVRKGIDKATKNLHELKKVGNTIPHPVDGQFGAAHVLLKPAAPGTGVIAGGVVRAIMELGGVKDVLTKVIGRTSNPVNVAWATLEALREMRTPDEIVRLRGLEAAQPEAE